tara:strand:- start:5496 stop:6575 length:1080 start_codon:yes stop_codon:yes gene_type:complete
MKKIIIILLFTSVLSAQTNTPDKSVNLALIDEAKVTGTIDGGRGNPSDILFDPVSGNYATLSDWSEYGVLINEELITDFKWIVEWKNSKLINYLTFGGTYPNQPQPNVKWKISYFVKGKETTLDEGVGGWIDSGIYEFGGINTKPFEADKVMVKIFTPGKSIHLRGRGSNAIKGKDKDQKTKATLIQLLPYETDVVDPPVKNDSLNNIYKIVKNLESDFYVLAETVTENEENIKKINSDLSVFTEKTIITRKITDTLTKANYILTNKLNSLEVRSEVMKRQIEIMNRRGANDMSDPLNDMKSGFEILGDCNNPNVKIVCIGDLNTNGFPLYIYNVDLYVTGSVKGLITKVCEKATINGK